MRLARLALLLSVSLLLAAVARAQAVRWEPSDNDPAEIVLVFENCAPSSAPRVPAVDGAKIDLSGQMTRTEFINFRRTDYVQFTYRVSGRGNAPITIPAFEVKTDKGNLRVPAFTTAAARNPSLDNAASSSLQPGSTTLWAGEVFPITYVLDVARRNFNQLETNPDWNATPLVAEDWSKPEPGERIVNGEARLNIVYRARAYAKTPGALPLNSVLQNVRLQTGSIGFGLFSAPRIERISVESDRPALTIRPLPVPAPAGFSGGVGQFKLVSKVVPEKAAVGEPVTWTLELSGTGNWPDVAGLPQRDVSNDFQVVQPKAKRTPADGKLFDVTLAEDVVLVPTKAGNYNLGPVSFSYFDPKSGTYKTISAPRTTVIITAPEASKFNVAPTAPAQTPDTPPTTSATTDPSKISNPKSQIPPSAPAAPAGIPRDPLPGTATASTPLSLRSLAVWLIAPFAGVLAYWFVLAVRRAQQTDPLRPRRDAHARLAATIKQLGSNPGAAPSPQLLLAWQRDAAVIWQVAHAAPSATALPHADWSALWAETDRALYGTQPSLPSDWSLRATAALAAKPVPGFNPLRLFLPRNLFPFAALLVLAFLLAPALRAAEPAVAYADGKFPAAEKAWREALAKNPTDWIARHNLALALAQQDKVPEAAAQAAIAFVQNPAHPSVRWHLALASEKGGTIPAPLAPFLHPTPRESLAQLASPATWQRVLVASAFLTALALAWLLTNSYGRRSGLVSFGAIALIVVSVALAAASVIGWKTYATAADRAAVIAFRGGTLRSIPTEADTTQKTSPLPAGSIALAGRTLLGWTQLTFDNGQTGWVRNEELLPLWR
ncbi:MAG: BatD family protein [Verrucomicrobia bacterium]|nr:BatD family protein [Verrucomicrobiota bacterium]